jgi:hypothetical protein
MKLRKQTHKLLWDPNWKQFNSLVCSFVIVKRQNGLLFIFTVSSKTLLTAALRSPFQYCAAQ